MTVARQLLEVARPGTRWGKAAIQRISARFKILKRKNGGVLTAETVLDDARSSSSPLHRYFEWDDSKAAERFRLEQARLLIRSVYVVVKEGGETISEPVQANVIVEFPEGGRGYVATAEVMTDDEMAAQALERIRFEMESWAKRWGRFARFRRLAVRLRKLVREVNLTKEEA